MYLHLIVAPDSPYGQWVEPSSGTTAFFLAIVGLILVAWCAAIRKVGWSPVHWVWPVLILAASGVVQTLEWVRLEIVPPPPLIVMAMHGFIGVALVVSPAGARLAREIPLRFLIGFQAFRLPLELWLSRAYDEGTVPVQMTYSGHNFDIVTGIAAIVAFIALSRSDRFERAIAWGFNVLGFGLLIAVGVIAVRSLPFPFVAYDNDPPLMLPMHFPFGWIVTAGVLSAMIGHLLVFRRLLTQGSTVD